MNDPRTDLCERVLGLVDGRAEAAVMVTSVRTGLTRFANSFVHQHVGEETVAVSLKVANEGRVAAAESTRVGDDALLALVESTLEICKLRPVDEDWPGFAPPDDVSDVAHHDPATDDASPSARAAQVRAFVDAGPGLRAAGYVDSESAAVAFASTTGHTATARATRATVDGIHQSDTSAGKGHATSVRLSDIDGATTGAIAADLATRGAAPTDIEPGHYQVVLAPECVATIAVFLSAYGFNAKEYLEGQSFVDLDTQQFDPAFSMWDDVTDSRALGIPFDTEGTPKRPLEMVRDGVSTALVHDRRTARKSGVDSTGHAIPGGEVWGPFPSNVFVAPGGQSVDELVADVDRGLLVTEFNYCRVLDPKTQVVTGLTRNGTFLVEKGAIVRPVTNLRFTQSFVEALAPGSVLGVGSAARFADCEFGVGVVHAPAMRLAAWNFTGGARG